MSVGSGPAGTVSVDIEGDYSKFESGLNKHGKAAGDKFGSSFGGSFGKKVAGLGAAYLGTSFLKSTIGEASDLAEAINVTGLAFGTSRAQADKFAKSAALNLGLAESEARALQASMGNVMVGFGASQDEAAKSSEKLITRAADIGSAWNASTSEVSDAIISAFTTSTEPLRRFGVIIDEHAIKLEAERLGLLEAGGEMSNYAKQQAVMSLVMEQTNNVAGDFLNTQDGVANSSKQVTAQWKDMQANLGSALLPLLSSLLGVMKALGPQGMKMVLMGAALAFAFVKIAQAGQALSGVFTLLAANPWILAALAIVAAGVLIYQNWDTVKAKGAQLVDWFVGAAGSVKKAFSGVADAISGPFRAAFNAIAKAWNATVGKLAFSVPSWVPGFLGGGKSFAAPKIPELAGGAVVSSPTLAMVGEYPGAQRNPEIVSPVDTMRATMLDAISASSSSSSSVINIAKLEVRQESDIEAIARALDRRRQAAARSAGRPELVR